MSEYQNSVSTDGAEIDAEDRVLCPRLDPGSEPRPSLCGSVVDALKLSERHKNLAEQRILVEQEGRQGVTSATC